MEDSDPSTRKRQASLEQKAPTPAMTPKRQRVAAVKTVPSSTPITPATKKRASVANGKPASNRKRGRPPKKTSDVFDFADDDFENSAPVATPLILLSAKKNVPNGTSESEAVINKCPLELEPIVYSSEDSQPESVSAQTNGTNGTADEPNKFCASCFIEIEEEEEHITCSGECLLSFHTKCLKEEAKKEADSQEVELTPGWKCIQCTTGKHNCFVCSQHTDTVQKCGVKDCNRFYHVDCLTRYPHKKSESSFTCPLHFCLTCFNDHDEDNVYRSVKNRLLQCVKCPTAYHFLDDCLAAGSAVIIPKMFIECPEHLSRKSFKVINVPYCFACLEGGELTCCESCPAAFHESCLEFAVPSGSQAFYCGACLKRKQVVYGETVWVKCGNYRWWPARVIPPANVPDNLMRKKWDKGQFVVQFAGSLDYYWVDKGRVFPYMEGDCDKQHNKPAGKSKMHQLYQKALEEAPKFFEIFRQARSVALTKKVKQAAPYTKLLVNRPVGTVASLMKSEKDKEKKKAKEGKDSAQPPCNCNPNADAPCSSDDCENRLVNVECNKDNCKASADKCHNRRFKKRAYASTRQFNTGDRGWGLKAEEDIKKGTFVIEYVGELIDDKELEIRLREKARINDRNFYFLTLDKDRIIDAGPAGNNARFMNHSCTPNCITQKWVVDGFNRVGLFAIRDIKKGEELTFNYNLVAVGGEKTRCHCGSQDCIKFIGERPSKPSAADKATPKTNGINKKKPGRKPGRKPLKKNIPQETVVNGNSNENGDTNGNGDAVASLDADTTAVDAAAADDEPVASDTKLEPVSPSSHQEE